jgi:hypothetical protein
MEALSSFGYDATGMIPATMLNWILHFNLSNESHVHQMVTMRPYTITNGTHILYFHCYICYTKYTLKVLESGNKDDGCTCPNEPVHHLHTYMVPEKYMVQSKTEIEMRCCFCKYHAVLICQSPPIPKDTMSAFIASLKQKRSANNTLKTFYNLLREAFRGKSHKAYLNNPNILGICQDEHVM